jgi:hypothetical protein
LMQRIALLGRRLCPLRRAQARCADVVRAPIMRIARCAECGMTARCAEPPLWAT